jgi:hypothetical protein
MSRAETVLAQAIGIRSAAKLESLVDAEILNNLGAVYPRQHKYGKAEESYKRSLEIAERLLGPVHSYLTGFFPISGTSIRRCDAIGKPRVNIGVVSVSWSK